VSPGFWDSLDNQRAFFSWLETQLNIASPDDWYRYDAAVVAGKGGRRLLSQYYAGSLPKALATVYPAVNWEVWRFRRLPKRIWQDPSLVVAYFSWVYKQLGMSSLADWYQISTLELYRRGLAQSSVRDFFLLFFFSF
jgi:hypothetical protein